MPESMREKYQELLSPHREMVMPLSYKKLNELQSFLDNTLLFLKQCRSHGGVFSEVKKSIEHTYGK